MAPQIENTTQYIKIITPVYFEGLKFNKSHICVNRLLKNSDFLCIFYYSRADKLSFSPNAPSTNYQSLAGTARDMLSRIKS